ncbi:MICOS complex subunit Mic60-like isoform X2 [Gigantopelta aegis]|uniref:MICOS complex subunit Mic60-like isoform X2 n=1 Tax=Gigantopelta aegis TaxID=1735272 RepID=UPI001B887ECB|nr:MICOS complex subunit Mic60-like isoform X2 [Gigantopelta aegis]
MWKATSTRFCSRLRCARCRRLCSSQTKKGDIPLSFKDTPTPPRKPAPNPKKGGFFGKFLGLTTLTAGGLVGYAWYDSSFKKTVEDNVPYSKEAFSLIFPYLPDSSLVKSLPEKKSDVPFVQTDKNCPKPKDAARPVSSQKTQPEKTPAGLKEDKQTEKERLKQQTAQMLKEKEMEEEADNIALELILHDLMVVSVKNAQKAIEMQKQVINTTKEHTRLLKKAMDDTNEILEKDNQWQAVSTAFQQREQAVKEAEDILCLARTDLEKLKHAIEDGKQSKITKRNKMITQAQETLNKQNNELGNIGAQVSKAESEAKMMSHYKDLVAKGRKQFQKELESIMPEVKLGKKGGKLTEDELNSMIAHAHCRIDQLQKQLAEQLSMEALHIEKAIEEQIKEDEKLASIRLGLELEKMQAEFDVQKDNWTAEARVDFEKELRGQLSRQAAAHSDHLRDVLKIQLEELEEQFERQMHVKLLEERQNFQCEVAGWISRLKGIEAAVEGRAEQEKMARMAQELWLACLALNGAIRLGNEEGKEWEDKIKPLTDEIDHVSDASRQHPFVETIIRTIPEAAIVRGVMTEDGLKERFQKVKDICRRVAMIDATCTSLFKYFVSYIQSIFVLDSVTAKSESDEIDLDKLDTYSILAQASYFMERGDVETAVKFMNQLTGAPCLVAADWIKEAILLLETRQAASTLTAFAAASGLSSQF